MADHFAPNLRRNKTTKQIMSDVCIALLPALIFSIYLNGINALLLTLVSVLTCVAAEFLWQKLTKQPVLVDDFSAILTGVLLAFNVTNNTPYWVIVLAAIFSIIVIKQIFGGIGSNVINPALAGRLFIMMLYPGKLTIDGFTSASVLSAAGSGSEAGYSVLDMFLGNIPGALGETSKLLLLAGFAYLIFRKEVNWLASVVYIAIVVAMTTLAGGDFFVNLFGGGLILGGCFMLTDYNFVNRRGNILLAVVAAVITAAIRIWGIYPEGVCFGILAANCLAGLISRFDKQKVYGVE